MLSCHDQKLLDSHIADVPWWRHGPESLDILEHRGEQHAKDGNSHDLNDALRDFDSNDFWPKAPSPSSIIDSFGSDLSLPPRLSGVTAAISTASALVESSSFAGPPRHLKSNLACGVTIVPPSNGKYNEHHSVHNITTHHTNCHCVPGLRQRMFDQLMRRRALEAKEKSLAAGRTHRLYISALLVPCLSCLSAGASLIASSSDLQRKGEHLPFRTCVYHDKY